MANTTSSAFSERLLNVKNSIGYDYYSLSFFTAGVLVLVSTLFNLFLGKKDGDIPYKAGIPFIGQWSFFTRRHRFLDEGIRQLGNVFSFNVLHHKIVALAGEEGRTAFFTTKEFDLPEGYKILFGGAPNLEAISVEKEDSSKELTWFAKRLNGVLRKDRLERTLPLMFSDLERLTENWGNSGQFDPFIDIYNMVFVLTIRAISCREIAESPEAVKRIIQLYWDMEKASTPMNVMFPWLPTKSRKARNDATTELYTIFKKIVDERKEKGITESDAMQSLIDTGDGVNEIVGFVLGSLFAGIINTGINASWMTLFLHANPKWKARVTSEIRTFAAKYSSPGLPLYQQLSQIPPNVWEEEMPDLELCLKETLRVVLTGALLRRHVGKEDIIVEGKRIKPGMFVAMPVAGAHHNEGLYSDPYEWNPDRYEQEEDKKEQYAYFAWGAGRHPCLGMRFAKLEIKTILALFLAQYDYELVHKNGEKVTTLPEPYRENLYQVPPTKTVYVKYTRISD